MKIFVTVKPGSRKRLVEKIDNTHFTIFVKEAPFKGLANKAAKEALADCYNIPKSRVILKSGATFRQKIFEILET